MTLTITKTEVGYDEWGNPTTITTTENYTIATRDFQPTPEYDTLVISDTGVFTQRMRKLFLKGSLYSLALEIGQTIEVDNVEYMIIEIRQYEKHKEVICKCLA